MKKLNYLFSLLCFMAISTWAFAQPANNECSGAIDLSSSLGQGADNTITVGPYDNTSATTEASDPTEGFSCFGEPDGSGTGPTLENTLWFSFTGDGNVYFIEATSVGCSLTGAGINDNDTQIAIYSGECGSLSPVTCNEDGPNLTGSTYPAGLGFYARDGVEYYMLVDGFNYNGSISEGEFCLEFTQAPEVLCNNADVTAGTITLDPTVLCQPDNIVRFSYEEEGVLAPNEGSEFGFIWMVSTDDLAGSVDPFSTQNVLGTFPVTLSPANNPGINLESSGFNPGIYYITLYAFGNGTVDDMDDLVFDSACTFASNSARIEYYPEDACPLTNVLDVDKAVLGMTVFPNPAKDVINLNVNAQEQHTNATLMITNITGQVVEQQQVNLLSGANAFDINVSDMPTGVYMISIESETHQSVTKFVKQ